MNHDHITKGPDLPLITRFLPNVLRSRFLIPVLVPALSLLLVPSLRAGDREELKREVQKLEYQNSKLEFPPLLLLHNVRHEKEQGTDSAVGDMKKEGTQLLSYDIGRMAGVSARKMRGRRQIRFRTRVLGEPVLVAFERGGGMNSRKTTNFVEVTFYTNAPFNFFSTIQNRDELLQFFLMALTFPEDAADQTGAIRERTVELVRMIESNIDTVYSEKERHSIEDPNEYEHIRRYRPIEKWFQAAKNKNVQKLKEMMNRGFPEGTKKLEGKTALHFAAKTGEVDLVKRLHEMGIPFFPEKSSGKALVRNLVLTDKPAILKYLHNQGAILSNDSHSVPPLFIAIINRKKAIVEYLLRQGVQVNSAIPFEGRKKVTPLMITAEFGSPAIVKRLIEAGAEVNAKAANGATPFTLAARFSRYENAEVLIDHGAEVRFVLPGGKTPLMKMVEAGKKDLVQKLIRAGARVGARSKAARRDPHRFRKETDPYVWSNRKSRPGFGSKMDSSENSAGLFDFENDQDESDEGSEAVLGTEKGRTATGREGLTARYLARIHERENIERILEFHQYLNRTFSEPLKKRTKTIQQAIQKFTSASSSGREDARKRLLAYGEKAMSLLKDHRRKAGPDARDRIDELIHTLAERYFDKKERKLQNWFQAARSANVEALKKKLSRGVSVNRFHIDGWTALHHAVKKGHDRVVQCLLRNGADPDRKTIIADQEVAPLHIAIEEGNHKIVRRLLEHGARIDTMRSSGETPIHTAARVGQPECLRLLLETSSPPFSFVSKNVHHPIISAVERGHEKAVSVFLKKGIRTKFKNHALLVAVRKEKSEIAKKLLAAGADPDAKPRRKDLPPFILAIKQGDQKLVQAFIDAGADVSRRSEHEVRMFPLAYAAREGRVKIIQKLVEAGANLNAKTKNGDTALQFAVAQGKRDALKRLLDLGAELDTDGVRQETP